MQQVTWSTKMTQYRKRLNIKGYCSCCKALQAAYAETLNDCKTPIERYLA